METPGSGSPTWLPPWRRSAAQGILALLLLALPMTHRAEDYSYVTNNGTITITAFLGYGGVVTIPSEINGLPVTGIGDYAFRFNPVTSVTIPDTVTTIGTMAFDLCRSLTNVVIGNHVTTIGDSAFRYCMLVTAITIPDSVLAIGERAFLACTGLTSVVIGSSVTGIGPEAFSYCERLGNVTIPDSAINIGTKTFSPCLGLTNVTIGNHVTTIGDSAFYYCESLRSVSIPDSVTHLGSGAFGFCESMTNVIIGSGVTSIEESAFYYCTNLIHVAMGGSVRNIGVRAFTACENLTGLQIPDGVTNFGYAAFAGCVKWTNFTIPSSVTTIGSEAFNGCASLTSVAIPSNVTNIGSYAFENCLSLDAIMVDASNPNYSSADGVLFDKYRTTLIQFPAGKGGDYSIPDTVVVVGDAFGFCPRLTSITMPASVAWIGSYGGNGSYALYECTGLTAITVDPQNSAYSSLDGVLFDKGRETLIQFPAGRTGNYYIPGGVMSIGHYAFNGCVGLADVAIPESVTWIGDFAFYFCSGLSRITVPSKVASIGFATFFGCTGLSEMVFGEGLSSIQPYAFGECTNLVGVYFEGNAPANVALSVLSESFNATVYYLPGTTGWGDMLGGRPTAFWMRERPVILKSNPSFGVQTNGFGFIISWATNLSVVVEATTNLASPAWLPIGTNLLANGSSYFHDPDWTNYPARFYRLRFP